MAEGLNKVLLIGNVGQEPELRYTQGGQAVLNFRMATNERYQDRGGEWQDRTEWHNVVVWGRRAEGLGKVLAKGSHLFVEGRLQTRSWEDNQGQKRYTTEVVSVRVLLLGRGRPGAEDAASAPPRYEGGRGGQAGGPEGEIGGPGPEDFSDDDIPF